MTPYEYFDACLPIQYSKDAVDCVEFGSPMNCYGFVYWFYRLCRGVELDSAGVLAFDNIHKVEYNKVDDPVDGDVVNLRTLDGYYATHVGIYYGGMVYHFTARGLVAQPFARMQRRIKEFYRVVENKEGAVQAR